MRAEQPLADDLTSWVFLLGYYALVIAVFGYVVGIWA